MSIDIIRKSDRFEHKIQSKSEKQYLRGIIHNLSLQRWTDQEIVDYLNFEKGVNIARSTVNAIKNQVEKQARKWYLELEFSRYKYIATYKERLDSLFSYQKKLNEILNDKNTKSDLKVKVIAELHSIELSIFNLLKELPEVTLDKKEFKKYMLPDMPIRYTRTEDGKLRLFELGITERDRDNFLKKYGIPKVEDD